MKKANRLRRLLAEYGRKIARCHFVMGTMGNISVREGGIVWIKRGGSWLEKARPADFIAVDLKTAKAKSNQSPSKEIFLHLGSYRARPDIQAVVHTHPVMTTALATVGINPNKAKMAVLPYYSPGSKRLARQVQEAIKRKDIVILANHGLVTVGKDIKEAYRRTCACERRAKKILARLQK